ncbi:hypothetical protein VNO78_07469 [Psophocarpus tetragonolobus]|uniref:Uncharacterized protein n=1 Tax=Psophocarpus tetragonolobus TaxID=3891 RepID=A0AAN9ST46_PSOTE
MTSINDLPINVINVILHLPIHDLVKTSIQWRKWSLVTLSLHGIKFESAEKCGDNIEGGRVSDLMKDLTKIERLCLGGGYIKILSAINQRMLHKSVDTLRFLKLDGVHFEKDELLFIISLLESSPNLKELDIESYSYSKVPQMILKEFDCCLSRLQIVKITVKVVNKNVLNLIQFVHAKFSSLKILNLRVGLGLNQSNALTLLSISSDLLQMKRASPRVEVRFLYTCP